MFWIQLVLFGTTVFIRIQHLDWPKTEFKNTIFKKKFKCDDVLMTITV